MADPQTTNVGLYIPTLGSDVGTWDKPVNANASAEDSLFSNVSVIALTNANVTLTTPPNSGAAWAGPYQSQSAVLRFTGALSGNCTITLPRPGFWMAENLCTGNFVVILASAAPSKVVALPPGETTHVYCDGTDVKFADFGRVGSYVDLAASTVPAWITACTVPPYLNCDGSTFNATTYPALNTYLGGNTLPDLRGRLRATLNQTTGRITSAGGGVDGNTILAAGGAQTNTLIANNLPASIPYTDPGHTHTYNQPVNNQSLGAAGVITFISPATSSNTGSATTGITINPGSPNTPITNLPPIAVGGITLVRAG